MQFVQGNEEYIDVDLYGVEEARIQAVQRKRLSVNSIFLNLCLILLSSGFFLFLLSSPQEERPEEGNIGQEAKVVQPLQNGRTYKEQVRLNFQMSILLLYPFVLASFYPFTYSTTLPAENWKSGTLLSLS